MAAGSTADPIATSGRLGFATNAPALLGPKPMISMPAASPYSTSLLHIVSPHGIIRSSLDGWKARRICRFWRVVSDRFCAHRRRADQVAGCPLTGAERGRIARQHQLTPIDQSTRSHSACAGRSGRREQRRDFGRAHREVSLRLALPARAQGRQPHRRRERFLPARFPTTSQDGCAQRPYPWRAWGGVGWSGSGRRPTRSRYPVRGALAYCVAPQRASLMVFKYRSFRAAHLRRILGSYAGNYHPDSADFLMYIPPVLWRKDRK